MNIIPEQARWRGAPSPERTAYLKNSYLCDSGDAMRGIKFGKTYGCLYRIRGNRLIAVQYDSSGCMIEGRDA